MDEKLVEVIGSLFDLIDDNRPEIRSPDFIQCIEDFLGELKKDS